MNCTKTLDGSQNDDLPVGLDLLASTGGLGQIVLARFAARGQIVDFVVFDKAMVIRNHP